MNYTKTNCSLCNKELNAIETIHSKKKETYIIFYCDNCGTLSIDYCNNKTGVTESFLNYTKVIGNILDNSFGI